MWYSKNLCCKLWNQSLKILYLTCIYKVFARFYYTLKSDAFPWFQSTDLLLFGLSKTNQRSVQMWLYSQTWYPKWYPKYFFEKYTFWAFQQRIKHGYSHPTSKVTYRSVLVIFWYSTEFLKMSHFRLKLWKFFNFYKDAKRYPGCVKTRAIRRLKA